MAISSSLLFCFLDHTMLPPMKAMKGGAKAMSKGALAQAVAEKCEVKRSVATKFLGGLSEAITTEVKKNGAFNYSGLCRIKTRVKPATKAGKKEIFGKLMMVKARPAKTVVKAFPAASLKALFK